MSNEITNEQLEAWAGLGPWFISPLVTPPLIYRDKRHGGTGLWIASIYADAPGEREHHKPNAALIAAAPALAAALLAERKAREVEVKELRKLRDMVQTARGLLTPDWRGHCDAAAAAQIIDQALKGPTHE